jgi:hypothetical protein
MKRFKSLVTLICLVLAGCTHYVVDGIDSQSEVIGSKTPSIAEMLNEFRATHGYSVSTKAGGASDLNILDIQKETYVFDIADDIAGSPLLTRSGSVDDLAAQSLTLSTVTFESNGKTGFSILTDDSRIARIYAFTESGQLSDTTYILGLRIAVNNIKHISKQDVVNYYKNSDITTRATTSTHLIKQKLTASRWHQGLPYNQLTPVCASLSGATYGGHMPAGCTAIAVGQAIAYLSPPNLSGYSLSAFRQQATIASSYPSTPTTVENQVATFVNYIGACVDMDYSCSGSGAWVKDIRNELTAWGITYLFDDDANVATKKAAYNIYMGRPHITSGNDKHGSAHTWIFEGVDCYYTSATAGTSTASGYFTLASGQPFKFYCNWGWGPDDSSGWFANFESPTEHPYTFLNDEEQLYLIATSFIIPSL